MSKNKYISGHIELKTEEGFMTAEDFTNMFNESLAEAFKKRQNIKARTGTTITTGTRDWFDYGKGKIAFKEVAIKPKVEIRNYKFENDKAVNR